MGNRVLVELVADRELHKDLLYGTEIVWLGKGDRQYVPAELWPKFAHHPDVYGLVRQAPIQPAEEAKPPAPAPAPKGPTLGSAASEKIQKAAGEGTDLVLVSKVNENAEAPQGEARLDRAALDAMSDAAIHTKAKELSLHLHPRLQKDNLRVKFLEALKAAKRPKAALSPS